MVRRFPTSILLFPARIWHFSSLLIIQAPHRQKPVPKPGHEPDIVYRHVDLFSIDDGHEVTLPVIAPLRVIWTLSLTGYSKVISQGSNGFPGSGYTACGFITDAIQRNIQDGTCEH